MRTSKTFSAKETVRIGCDEVGQRGDFDRDNGPVIFGRPAIPLWQGA